MYEIEFTPSAAQDLQSLPKPDQKEVLDGVDANLKHEPTVESRNRKKLRPNDVAEWELRLSQFRVFYNVDQEVLIVRVEAVGLKERNLLFIRGKRRNL